MIRGAGWRVCEGILMAGEDILQDTGELFAVPALEVEALAVDLAVPIARTLTRIPARLPAARLGVAGPNRRRRPRPA